MGFSAMNMGVYHLLKMSKIMVGLISVREERVTLRNKSRSLQVPLCSVSVERPIWVWPTLCRPLKE